MSCSAAPGAVYVACKNLEEEDKTEAYWTTEVSVQAAGTEGETAPDEKRTLTV